MRRETTARAVILQRIHTALHDVPPTEQPEHVAVARDYRRSGIGTREEVVERFCERVSEYKVTVQRIEEASLPQAIASACRARGVGRLVIPADVPSSWLPVDVELLRDSTVFTNEWIQAVESSPDVPWGLPRPGRLSSTTVCIRVGAS